MPSIADPPCQVTFSKIKSRNWEYEEMCPWLWTRQTYSTAGAIVQPFMAVALERARSCAPRPRLTRHRQWSASRISGSVILLLERISWSLWRRRGLRRWYTIKATNRNWSTRSHLALPRTRQLHQNQTKNCKPTISFRIAATMYRGYNSAISRAPPGTDSRVKSTPSSYLFATEWRRTYLF